MAASLVVMIGRGTPAWKEGETVAGRASDLRALLVRLAEEDAGSVAGLVQLARRPASPDRAGIVASGLLEASRPPLAIAEAAAEIVELAAVAEVNGKPIMRADAAVAAVLAAAATSAAALVVETNLNAISDDAATPERLVLRRQAHHATVRAEAARVLDRLADSRSASSTPHETS
jgi:formiminotetrahydrofolate cyclodeaminase